MFDVHVDDKSTEQLSFDEMLGVVAQLTVPKIKDVFNGSRQKSNMSLSETETTLKTVIMEKTYNAQKAIIAQKEYLKELAKNNQADWMADNFSKGIGFAPSNGICYRCKKQIYSEGGISVERASTELTTGCPFCHTSYVD
ncbi:hypothetical protein ACIXN4_10475 [Bacteroides fragilis]